MYKWEIAVGHSWTMEWLFNLCTVSRSNWEFVELISVEDQNQGEPRKQIQSKDKNHQQPKPKINMLLSP